MLNIKVFISYFLLIFLVKKKFEKLELNLFINNLKSYKNINFYFIFSNICNIINNKIIEKSFL